MEKGRGILCRNVAGRESIGYESEWEKKYIWFFSLSSVERKRNPPMEMREESVINIWRGCERYLLFLVLNWEIYLLKTMSYQRVAKLFFFHSVFNWVGDVSIDVAPFDTFESVIAWRRTHVLISLGNLVLVMHLDWFDIWHKFLLFYSLISILFVIILCFLFIFKIGLDN